jgi:hypothetical protein
MKMLFLVALAFSSSVALAHNCPNEIKAIDAKMTSSKLSAADMSKVKSLRDKGEKEHSAGKHDDSMKSLSEAKKLLGI